MLRKVAGLQSACFDSAEKHSPPCLMPFSCLRHTDRSSPRQFLPIHPSRRVVFAHSWIKSTMAAAASNPSPNAFTIPVNKTAHAFDKAVLDATLSRRFFFAPAFEIYGGDSFRITIGPADNKTSLRCSRVIRLWSDRLGSAGKHPGCVEEAFHHRGGYVGAGYDNHDALGRAQDFGTCG